MMISPFTYIEQIKDKSYKELIKEKNDLIKEIKEFEKGYFEPSKDFDINEVIIECPSPEVVYQCNLEYLSALSNYMREKFNKEFIMKDFEQR